MTVGFAGVAPSGVTAVNVMLGNTAGALSEPFTVLLSSLPDVGGTLDSPGHTIFASFAWAQADGTPMSLGSAITEYTNGA